MKDEKLKSKEYQELRNLLYAERLKLKLGKNLLSEKEKKIIDEEIKHIRRLMANISIESKEYNNLLKVEGGMNK